MDPQHDEEQLWQKHEKYFVFCNYIKLINY
jgi:hypothetical protein